jgi:hypothetical protein
MAYLVLRGYHLILSLFMILGQSAAIAASLSIDQKTSVQKLPFESLLTELNKAKQVLRR